MINFYSLYNKIGLDKEHHGLLIEKLMRGEFTIELKPIEHIIKKHHRQAYGYTRFFLNGRWLEAEPYIMKDPGSAAYYAINLIHDRWLEAEPIIKKDGYVWCIYRNRFNYKFN